VDLEQITRILDGIAFLEERTKHYFDVLTNDSMFLQRTRGIAYMSRSQAEVMGAIGPTARASNVARDVRVESPYAAYAQYPVNMALDTRGDLEARFVVRVNELFESFRLIRQILAHLPEGELVTRMPRKIPAGEVVKRVEAPRGELYYFIKSNGTDKPERLKVRTPTICNMTSVIKLAVGHQLADVPMILAGIDPCFSCNDRTVQLDDPEKKTSNIMTWEDLRQHGIRHYEALKK
jgi:ech hydrogenase subunit E